MTDDNRVDLVAFFRNEARHFFRRLTHGAGVECARRQEADGTRKDGRRVADRHADPTLPDIETDNSPHAV
jgi:hypothetical protein